MRYRGDYSLYARALSSGRVVIYYMTYDKDEKRTAGRSTGKRTKSEARLYCNKLMREGKLIPEKIKAPTFKEYSLGWWDWDSCPYLKRRRARRTLSRSYADIGKHTLDHHLLPYFADMRLDLISDVDVESWLISRRDEGLSNKSANLYLSIFTVMMNEAVRLRIIKSNPATLVSKLKEDVFAIEILTQKEVIEIFPDEWESIWVSNEGYLANKLAACTGLRIGEVVGLRGIDFYGSYISVRGQFGRYGYVDTKTHKSRNIPIPSGLAFELAAQKKKTGEGYLFSVTKGVTPVSKDLLTYQLSTALEKIGIGKAAQKLRHLTFHSWRHFFNTTLRVANVADSKVRAITGHQSNAMTEHYTHYDTREFQEVRNVQEALLNATPGKREKKTKQTDDKKATERTRSVIAPNKRGTGRRATGN